MKKALSYGILLILIPLCIFAGVVLFNDRNYKLITIIGVFLTCIPFFLAFERKMLNSRTLVIIAVMVALSVVGRLIFFAFPGFKPVTATTVIAAMAFGPETGFLTGAMTAVISNFYYGQGPWTPFQMFSWGFLGFVAGLLAVPLRKNRVLLMAYGALSGVVFSLLMDIWTVMAQDGSFNLLRYKAAMLTSLPYMAIYAISNMVFLWFLEKPLGKRLDRIKTKYGL